MTGLTLYLAQPLVGLGLLIGCAILGRLLKARSGLSLLGNVALLFVGALVCLVVASVSAGDAVRAEGKLLTELPFEDFAQFCTSVGLVGILIPLAVGGLSYKTGRSRTIFRDDRV